MNYVRPTQKMIISKWAIVDPDHFVHGLIMTHGAKELRPPYTTFGTVSWIIARHLRLWCKDRIPYK